MEEKKKKFKKIKKKFKKIKIKLKKKNFSIHPPHNSSMHSGKQDGFFKLLKYS